MRKVKRQLFVFLAALLMLLGLGGVANAAVWSNSYGSGWPPAHSSSYWYCGGPYGNPHTGYGSSWWSCVIVTPDTHYFQFAVIYENGTYNRPVVSNGESYWTIPGSSGNGIPYHKQYCPGGGATLINLAPDTYWTCMSSTFTNTVCGNSYIQQQQTAYADDSTVYTGATGRNSPTITLNSPAC